MTPAPSRFCPMCGHDTLDPEEGRNALSRSKDVWVCSLCGEREAVADLFRFGNLPRHCYYDDDTDGTVLIFRGFGGYFLTGPGFEGRTAADLNREWGVTEGQARGLVLGAMNTGVYYANSSVGGEDCQEGSN